MHDFSTMLFATSCTRIQCLKAQHVTCKPCEVYNARTSSGVQHQQKRACNSTQDLAHKLAMWANGLLSMLRSDLHGSQH